MPAFGQSREDKLRGLQEIPKATSRPNEITSAANQITNINLEQKKKPYDVKINNKARQPTVTPNVKYTDKHRFRRYKTKVEPNLFKKIEVNEEDDVIDKIRAAFNPDYKIPNTNFSEQITAPAPFNKGADQPPITETKMYSGIVRKHQSDTKPVARLEEINDISRTDYEELTFQPSKTDEEFLSSLKSVDLSKIKPKSDDDYEPFYEDDEVFIRGLKPTELNAQEKAANLIKYNFQKHLQNKTNKTIRADYEIMKFEKSLGDGEDMTISPIVRGNKVIGLNSEINSTPNRKQKYSQGLDKALPTPKKLGFTQRKGYRDSGTDPRGPGRPPESAVTSTWKLQRQKTPDY